MRPNRQLKKLPNTDNTRQCRVIHRNHFSNATKAPLSLTRGRNERWGLNLNRALISKRSALYHSDGQYMSMAVGLYEQCSENAVSAF